VTDGTGQPIDNGLLIFVDMAVGMDAGVIVFVEMFPHGQPSFISNFSHYICFFLFSQAPMGVVSEK
jgi:hypothetical protein